MARPTKTPENKKGTIIKFRATDAEKIRIDQLAFDAGLTVTDLIKNKVFDSAPRRRKASPERAMLIKGMADLGRIGSNINQIARALNSGRGEFEMPKDYIQNALFELTKLSNRIFDTLDNGN